MSENANMTTNDVAKKLGITIDQVYSLIRSGKLAAEKIDNRYEINPTDLEEYVEKKKTQDNKTNKLSTIKKIKKIITFIGTILGAIIVLWEGLSANAAGGPVDASGYISWNYVEETATLDIMGSGAVPSLGEMEALGGIPWAAYMSDITSVNITDGITAIGDGAFSGLGNLESVYIASSVIAIGSDAFAYDSKLESIEFLGTAAPFLFPGAFGNTGSEIAFVGTIYVPDQAGAIFQGMEINGTSFSVAGWAIDDGTAADPITPVEPTTPVVTTTETVNTPEPVEPIVINTPIVETPITEAPATTVEETFVHAPKTGQECPLIYIGLSSLTMALYIYMVIFMDEPR